MGDRHFKTRAGARKTSSRRHYSYVTKTIGKFPRERRRVSIEKFERYQALVLALQKLSQNLVSEQDVRGVLDGIMKTLGEALGAVWVNLWEVTQDGAYAIIKQGYGRGGRESYIAHSKAHPIKIGTAWVGRAIATKKPWGTSDTFKDPHLPRAWVSAVKDQGFHAILCTPQVVESSSKAIGSLCVYWDKPKTFTDWEMRIVQTAANQAAVAILNARTYQDLLAEKDKTVNMIQSLNEGVILYDVEGKIALFNAKAEELLWISNSRFREEAQGGALTEAVVKAHPEFADLRAIGNLSLAEYETKEYETAGSSKTILEVVFVPVRDAQGGKIGSMRVLRDVTKEKSVELIRANIVSVASHQMRTPLTAMRWSLESVMEDTASFSEVQKKRLRQAIEASGNMLHLLNDLLQVSRMDERKYGYAFLKIDAMTVVRGCVAGVAGAANRRGVSVEVQEPQSPLPPASIDAGMLGNALANLLDNAVNYSRSGGRIVISCAPNASGDLVISVADKGIGIPSEDQPYLFNKFFRARNAMLFRTSGTGLGLYIAKQIVEKHNGRLTFESEENRGTTFFVSLPLQHEKMPASGASLSQAGAPAA